ncbi:MAG TPA: hypothetical protein VIH99_01965 [Bdellovibrionota bacterium]|jgi:hypothetical protein
MKNALMIAAMVVAGGPIIIDPVFARTPPRQDVCSSTGVADGGYQLVIALDKKSAELSEQTIGGPRPLANLECQVLRDHGPNHPDKLYNTLYCSDSYTGRINWVARRYVGGIGGIDEVQLKAAKQIGEMIIEEEVEFGRLDCRN